MTHTHESLIAAAEGLVPLIRQHAARAERDRKPSDEVIAAAVDAGLFDLMSATEHGGANLDLDTFFEVGVRLGEADASHAWVLCFYIEHVWMLHQFPKGFQDELFAGRTHVLAPAMIALTGKAAPAEGGYRLSGRWQWGTGCMHGEWVLAGGLMQTEAGLQTMFFALPTDEVTIEDTWHTDGMRGTGSNDIVVDDVFVPADRTVDISTMSNGTAVGSQLYSGPLWSTPMMPILTFAASMPVLGQARFAVAEFTRQLEGRTDFLGLTKKTEDPVYQRRLGGAHLDVHAAEALMRSVLADVMDQRAAATEPVRVQWMATIAHAVHICRHAITVLCEAAGASSHFVDNPLQRTRRDVETMCNHVVFDLDLRHQEVGRITAGLPSGSLMY